MKTLISTTVLAFVLGISAPAGVVLAQEYSEEKCVADLTAADQNGDGQVDSTEGAAWAAVLPSIDANSDGAISTAEVANACKTAELRETLKPKEG